ncbi:MAG TPA: TMEM165/GDT1 family protein [Rhizomicrobium sp.]|nr:TMEM165/GDT1 family protein [Rhizomicrobium sp.]
METFLVSTAVVALAEIGDKTQLLAMVLAARYAKPVPIIFGILAATIANHLLAALGGYYLASFLSGKIFQFGVALSFIAMAAWTLVPDKIDDDETKTASHASAFFATLVTFFLVEIGDKTQIATAALAARFHDVVIVAAGTTTGMMIADVPAVFLAGTALKRIPLRYVRFAAAAIFFALGIWGLIVAMRM